MLPPAVGAPGEGGASFQLEEPASPTVPAPKRQPAVCALAIVDAANDAPVATATLTILGVDQETPTLSVEPCAIANAEGRITASQLPAPGRFAIVRAPGFVPQAIDADISGEATVKLTRASKVTINVIDELGKPVPKCTTILAAVNTVDYLTSFESLPNGVGHPFSKQPVWVSRTDDVGQAVLDELPIARYYLTVAHDMLSPTSPLGVASPFSVDGGSITITVAMQDLYGVAFACPDGVSARTVSWGVDFTQVDRSTHVASRLAVARQAFQAKFPSAFVYVHRPLRIDHDCHVRCSVLATDDTAWSGTWGLTPIRLIETPVLLEQSTSPSREITVRIRDAGNTDLSGIPLTLVDRDSHFRAKTCSGDRVVLPYGHYAIGTTEISETIYLALEQAELVVGEASAAEYVVTLPERLGEVVVQLTLPPVGPASPVTVSLKTDLHDSVSVMNWRPERGPIRRFLKGSTVDIRARSVGYEDAEALALPLSTSGPSTITLELSAKKAEANK